MGFGVLCGWLAGCLYCATWARNRSSIPAEHKVMLNWFLLLTGPIGLSAVTLVRRYPKLRGPFERLLDRVVRRGPEEPATPAQGIPLVLCTSDGVPVGSVGIRRSLPHDALETAKRILHEGLERRASDILIDPRKDDVYLLRYRIDGVLHEVARFPAEQGVAIVNCFKVASRLNIAERRRPQDGAFIAKRPDREIKFRSATAGTLYGEKIAIRIFDVQAGLMELDNLGLTPDDRQQIARFMERSDGMLLIAGPTGSGKTTTIYAALNLSLIHI